MNDAPVPGEPTCSGRRWFKLTEKMTQKKIYFLIPVFLLQAMIFIVLTGWIYPTVGKTAQNILWAIEFMGLADVLIILIAARKWPVYVAAKEPPLEDPGEVESRRSLTLAARAQRHDFVNHLMIISGLLHLNMLDDAKNYIRQFCADVQEVSDLLRFDRPILGSLILTKANQARARGIDFKLSVKTDLGHFLIKDKYVTRVLGNLIDNAMEAVETAPQKEIELIIYENEDNYFFDVIDSGNDMNESLAKKIFEPTFSTKGRGRGIGLLVARQLVDLCRGDVRLKIHPTTFTVRFPKNFPAVL